MKLYIWKYFINNKGLYKWSYYLFNWFFSSYRNYMFILRTGKYRKVLRRKNHPQAYHPNIVVIYFNRNKSNINQRKLRQKYFQMLTLIIINDKINCWSLFKSRTVFPISLKTMLPCVPKLVSKGYDI